MPRSHKILRAGALPRPRPGPESGGLSRLAHECPLPENSTRTERLGKEKKGGREFLGAGGSHGAGSPPRGHPVNQKRVSPGPARLT